MPKGASLARIAFLGTVSLVVGLFQFGIPIFSMQVYDRVIPSSNLSTLVMITLIVVFLTGVSSILEYSRDLVVSRMHWDTFLKLSEKFRPEELTTQASSQSEYFLIGLSKISAPAVIAILDAPWAVLFVLSLFVLNTQIGIAALTALALVACSFLGSKDRNKPRPPAVWGANMICANEINDSALAMGYIDHLRQAQKLALQSEINATFASCERKAIVGSAFRFLRAFAQIILIALGARLVVSRELDAGAIIASTMFFSRAIAITERVCAVAPTLRLLWTAMYREDSRRSLKAPPPAGLPLTKLSGRVTADGIAFQSAARAVILDRTSIDISPGTLVVVVGSESAGKSLLIRLLAGVEKPTIGTVRYDGYALADLDRSRLGRFVGYVAEDLQLQTGCVTDIIARGGTRDMAEVVRVATLVGLHRRIQELPSGYETDIAAGAPQFSKSFRKRLALARAFYGDPSLLILDEPTADLESYEDQTVLSSILQQKKSGSTVIVVSRAAGLVREVDLRLVVENRQVIQSGGREALAELLRPRSVV